MNTVNIILMAVLIAIISLILGYGIGKTAGREETKKAITELAMTFQKLGNAAKEGEKHESSSQM